MNKKKIIIFSAPSGSGKTTLVEYIIKEINLLEFSISCTTRIPRKNEIDGKHYYFLNLEEFKNKIKNKEFIEFEEVYPNKFYGTLKSELKKIWKKNKIIVFDVDVKGAIMLKKKFKDKAYSIFIYSPNIQILEKRLLNRKLDSIDTIKIRIKKAVHEMKYASKFDLIMINNNLKNAKKKIKKNIKNFIYQ